MTEATISTKHQIVIPREARKALGLKAGDKVLVLVHGQKIIIIEKPKSHASATRSLARGVYSRTYLNEERKGWD
jgi:AbrB family looped-hinge helix DNA binding protein